MFQRVSWQQVNAFFLPKIWVSEVYDQVQNKWNDDVYPKLVEGRQTQS